MRARWYDPVNGRFNRVDPYGGNPKDPSSLHRYLYTSNSPVKLYDPSGMSNTLVGQSGALGIRDIVDAMYLAMMLNIAYKATIDIADATGNIARRARREMGIMRVQMQIGSDDAIPSTPLSNICPPGVLVSQVQQALNTMYFAAESRWPRKHYNWLYTAVSDVYQKVLAARAAGGLEGRVNLKEEFYDRYGTNHRVEVENIKGKNLTQ